jgi:voltage-gated potassium channel Kch
VLYNSDQVERLREAGASYIVQPEFEAGVEVIRHVFQRYGVSGGELASIAAGRRRSFYSRDDLDSILIHAVTASKSAQAMANIPKARVRSRREAGIDLIRRRV